MPERSAIELRPDVPGTPIDFGVRLDEVCFRVAGGSAHLEHMDEDFASLMLDVPGRTVCLSIEAERRWFRKPRLVVSLSWEENEEPNA